MHFNLTETITFQHFQSFCWFFQELPTSVIATVLSLFYQITFQTDYVIETKSSAVLTYNVCNSVLLLKAPGGKSSSWLLLKFLMKNKHEHIHILFISKVKE